MKYLKRGATGLAAATSVAVLATLVPGAQAVQQPNNSSAPSSSVTASASASSAASQKGTLDSRVRGTFGRAGTVTGTFEPRRFVVKNGDTYATGVLHAVVRYGDGSLAGRPDRAIAIPVRSGRASDSDPAAARRTCDILHLVLGPLNLNLLGLKVHLDKVVLDIVAQSGAGNLLGNLLCAVVGLLDGTSLLDQLRLANVLNRILSILNL